jgi:hypothetical protein
MKIRYALLALAVAVLNAVGNAVFILNSEVEKVSLIVNAGGVTPLALSKWFLLLFSACALAFTFAYFVMQLRRAGKDVPPRNEKLEDRSVLIASLAVVVMGWILYLVLL